MRRKTETMGRDLKRFQNSFLRRTWEELVAAKRESLREEIEDAVEDPSMVEEQIVAKGSKIEYLIGVDPEKYPEIQDRVTGTPEEPSDDIFAAAATRVGRESDEFEKYMAEYGIRSPYNTEHFRRYYRAWKEQKKPVQHRLRTDTPRDQGITYKDQIGKPLSDDDSVIKVKDTRRGKPVPPEEFE